MPSSWLQWVVFLMAQWEPSAADLRKPQPVYSPVLWQCFHLYNHWRPEEKSGESQKKGDMSLSHIFYLTVKFLDPFSCWYRNRLCHQSEAKQGPCNMAACCKFLLSLSCLILPPFPAPGAISNGTAAVLTLKTGRDTQKSLSVIDLLVRLLQTQWVQASVLQAMLD